MLESLSVFKSGTESMTHTLGSNNNNYKQKKAKETGMANFKKKKN